MDRRARCSCGQLSVGCRGEPVRSSVCHCLDCQMRTGSAFAAQIRFRAEDVEISGNATRYERRAASGAVLAFAFCPTCGATVYYVIDRDPGVVAVPLGLFAEPGIFPPSRSVYESRRQPWVEVTGCVERLD